MTLRRSLLPLVAALALIGSAQAAGSAYVKVNGTPVPKDRADALLNEQLSRGTPDSPELQAAVREELVRREVLSQAARKAKLDKKPEVAGQMALASQAILIRAYLQKFSEEHPVTDKAINAEYEALKDKLGDKEYLARHILVETEDAAKALLTQLAKGEKFEELAKQSKDPGSREKGGELGWSVASSYVPEFGEALKQLAKGELSKAPVKTQFGYHVIRLDDIRAMTPPALEQVKPQISQSLQRKQIEEHMMALRKTAKVE